MFPFWTPGYGFFNSPYWFNYNYYYYNFPRLYPRMESDEFEDDDLKNIYEDVPGKDSENVKVQDPDYNRMRGEEDESLETDGLSGHGNAGLYSPDTIPQNMAGTAMNSDDIANALLKDDPDILSTLTAYGIPIDSARQVVKRIIESSTKYCK